MSSQSVICPCSVTGFICSPRCCTGIITPRLHEVTSNPSSIVRANASFHVELTIAFISRIPVAVAPFVLQLGHFVQSLAVDSIRLLLMMASCLRGCKMHLYLPVLTFKDHTKYCSQDDVAKISFSFTGQHGYQRCSSQTSGILNTHKRTWNYVRNCL